MMALWIALGFSVLYMLLQAYYLFYWHKTPKHSTPADSPAKDGVTIVLVARNEEKTISACLQGILQQLYPPHLMEIIVVDDHSTDDTRAVALRLEDERIRILELKDFPEYIQRPAFKKSAITLAVHQSRFENIVVTDADCLHPENWLRTIMYSLTVQDTVFQTAPVIYTPGRSMLEKMQEAEQLTLMLITGAGITSGLQEMANGANMAFKKTAFLKTEGYKGNEHYASGDDMFLIEKMRLSFPGKISFVKSPDATVYTEGKKDWASFLKQRLRWAEKNKGLQHKAISRIWIFVGIYHVLLLLFLLMSLFYFIPPWPFLLMFCSKWIADYMLIATATAYFQRTSLLRYFVPLQFLYTWYILRLGLMMMMGKKGDWETGRRAEGPHDT
jgi:poly-beta-1,6-N-acetyl-D-glucosamine synthase